jgi:hypothetical protein
MVRISKNFTLEEFQASDTAKRLGIINAVGPQEAANICALVHNVIQPLRDAMREPVKIGSGYRCPRLNKAVGGVSNSQHIKGEAADLCIDGDKAKGRKWFTWIMSHCDFDQLIWEHNAKGSYWVHVSFRADGKNRHSVVQDLMKK